MAHINEISEKWNSLKNDTTDRLAELKSRVMMNELLEQETENAKIKRIILITLAAIAIALFICGVAFAVYKFLCGHCEVDFDDEFDEDLLADDKAEE